VLPTLDNYSNVGNDWTDTYVDKLSARRKIGSKNRPSPEILAEAQALQDTFQCGLKMLCLAGHVSYPTMGAALWVPSLQQTANTY
ncbi:hypothetical protein DFH28DRAFT_915631, partial [Melampsora americana]